MKPSMFRSFAWLAGFLFAVSLTHAASVVFTSAPSPVQSGENYYVAAELSTIGGGDLTLWKNGGYFASGSNWQTWFTAGAWTVDSGSQTVEYYADGWDWNDESSAYAYAWVNVQGSANNNPPTASVEADLYLSGQTVIRPYGGSVQVTIRFKASDPDGNLSGIRPQVWHPGTGYFTNDGGAMTGQSGGSGEVVRSITIDRDGDWYFWTDAEDASGASSSSGSWGAGFRLNVIQSSPPPQAPTVYLFQPGANTTIAVGTALTLQSYAEDFSRPLATHNIDIQRPDGTWNWQGAFAYGEPYMGGPVGPDSPTASTRTVGFTFNQVGTWKVRAYAANNANLSASTAERTITVTALNQTAVTITPNSSTVNTGATVSFTASGGSGTGAYTWGGDVSGTGVTKNVTFNTSGVRTVTVYRAGDSSYLPSNTASATITVTATTYSLTVTNGTGGASGLLPGSVRTITANAAPVGHEFDSWERDSGTGSFASSTSNPTTFTMGADNATVHAVYRPIGSAGNLSLTVVGGSGSASRLTSGAVRTISASPASGQLFDSWVVDSGPAGVFADSRSSVTTYTMGAGHTVVRALYRLRQVEPDSDGDGMADAWEDQNFFNKNSAADAMLDADGDGLTNVAEYNLGTNPRVANSDIGAGRGNSATVAWPANQARSEAVGTTSGALDVDSAGAATYTVPIYTPPGVSGMNPSLALQYSSNASNGLLGVGWSLQGLSLITRGASSAELYPGIDAVTDPADGDSSDRFFLDGNRLNLISGGSYGDDGTEYRTGKETFSKIVYHSGSASWFEVTTKSGLKLHYGNTSDSRVSNTNPALPCVWLLNRIEDLSGNVIVIDYRVSETDGTTHYPYPNQIRYGGRSDQDPFAIVRFGYKSRTSDMLKLSQPGLGSLEIKHLMDEIAVYFKKQASAGGTETLVRKYSLEYDTSTSTSRSRLLSIQETGIDGKVLPKTEFAWNTESPTYSQINVDSLTSSNDLIYTGDFNGDGRADYVRIGPRRVRQAKFYLSSGSGFTVGPDFALNTDSRFDNGTDQILVGDINGDGLTDLYGDFIQYDVDGTFADGSRRHLQRRIVWLAQPAANNGVVFAQYLVFGGDRRFNQAPNTTFIVPRELFIDAGGSGQVSHVLADSKWTTNGTWTISTWDSASNNFIVTAQKPTGATEAIYAEDELFPMEIHGDGQTDLLIYQRPVPWGGGAIASPLFVRTGANAYFFSEYYYLLSSTRKFLVGDYNGDGRSDLLSLPLQGGTNQIVFHLGITQSLSTDDWYNQKLVVVDVNKDGRDDLIVQRTDSSQIWLSKQDSANLTTLTFASVLTGGPLKNEIAIPFDFDGDGRMDFFIRGDPTAQNTGTACRVLKANASSAPNDVITGVVNGLGATAVISYSSLSDPTVYTKGSAVAGMTTLQTPVQVVKSVTFDLGTGTAVNDDGEFVHSLASFTLAYKYEGLRAAPYRGVLGFAATEVSDSRTQLVTRVERRLDHPYTGFVTRTKTFRRSGTTDLVVSDYNATPSARPLNSGKSDMVFLSAATLKTWGLNDACTEQSAQTSNISLTQTMDDYGNVIGETIDYGFEGRKTTTTAEMWPADSTNWLIGRLKKLTVASEATLQPTDTRTTEVYYKDNDDLNNETISPLLVTKTVSEPLDAAKKLTTEYGYTDGAGHVNKFTITGRKDASTDQTRGTEYVYDSLKRFVTQSKRLAPTSAGGGGYLTDTYQPDQVRAVIASHTDPNNQTSFFEYDGFGRLNKVTTPDNVVHESKLTWTNDARGVVAVETTSKFADGAKHALPAAFAIYDRLGRWVRSGALNADGHPVWTEAFYDSRGNAAYVSQPWRELPATYDFTKAPDYTTAGVPIKFWTSFAFDAIGRLSLRTNSNGSTLVESYNGLSVTATASARYNSSTVTQTTKTTYDLLGRVTGIANNENLGQTDGRERDTLAYKYNASGRIVEVNAAGTTTTVTYDNRGLPMSLTDPNSGAREYAFNAFGELYYAKNARNQETRFDSDILGRLLTRVSVEGTTSWAYDTAPGAGKGLLASVSGSDANGGISTDTLEYDTSLPRVSKLTRAIAGTNFTVTPTYDAASRVSTVQYQSGNVTQSFKRGYSDLGYLREIRDMSSGLTGGTIVWALEEVTALGQPTSEITGNGVRTSSFYSMGDGALRTRIAWTQTRYLENQSYAVDGFGNVRQRKLYNDLGSVTHFEDYGVDLLNRLTSVSLNGTLTQTIDYDKQGNIQSKTGVGAYTYDATRKHAVTAAGGDSYTYDASGNRVTRNGVQEAWWTSFDQPTKLKSGAGESTFRYDSKGARIQQVTASGEARYYIDGSHEYSVRAGVTEARFQVASPTGRMLQVTAGTGRDYKYFAGDHLGSIESIADQRGQLVESLSYDPWGRRRLPDLTAGSPTRTTTVNRGFTGHEMLDELGLVHMNGRVYDPVLARFLSVDPVVSVPTVAQTYNGYSYVANNPLTLVDPSGFQLQTNTSFYAGWRGGDFSGVNFNNPNVGSTGPFNFTVSFGSALLSSFQPRPARAFSPIFGTGSPRGIAAGAQQAQSYLTTSNAGPRGDSIAARVGVAPDSGGRQRRDSVFPLDHITVATVSFVTGIVTPLTSSQNTDDFIEWVGLNNTGDLQAAKLTGQMTAVLPAVFAGAQQTPGPKVQPPVLRPVEITTPNAQMRANANARGTYVDPLTGRVVPANARLAADHIVPKEWIKQQSGFDKLTRAQQEFLLNHPLNTQGLPGPLNSSKGAKMPDEWFFYTGIPLNQNYVQDQSLRAQFLRGWIQQQINNFNAGNGNQ